MLYGFNNIVTCDGYNVMGFSFGKTSVDFQNVFDIVASWVDLVRLFAVCIKIKTNPDLLYLKKISSFSEILSFLFP